MLKSLGGAVLCGVAGYFVGMSSGMALVYALSPNPHDKDLEAAMTGAFFVGPLVAVLCFFGALLVLWRRGRRLYAPAPQNDQS